MDYSAAEALRELDSILRKKGIRPVVAQVMEGVREHSRDQLAQLFEEDAFYESLADVVTDFRQQTD